MSIKKMLFTLPVISLLALNVQAAENTNNKAATPQATTQKAKEDPNLAAFNQNVRIQLIQRANAVQNEQNVVVLTYEVSNVGKSKIKNVNWISAFTLNDQAFFFQEVQTQLEKAISAKKKENITVILPFDKLPENAKAVFGKLETPVGHLTVAKQIDFTNGKKIIVKQ
ncbi:hypothetical protein ACJ7Z2_00330 [Mannheimia glucosida]|uniref:hypothetical protein n=1 Tax=Mannheimia glucosida TaxID=85401 RepID=UPI003917E040